MSAKPLRILISGGARSGKSAFALERARQLGETRYFVATAEAGDDEMRARIARHRRERDRSFTTIEAPTDVLSAIADAAAESARETALWEASLERRPNENPIRYVLVIDCLTFWISNLLLRGDKASRIEAQIDRLARRLESPPFHVVLVSNEVGLGIVPDNRLAREFRDLVGRGHQRIAPLCDELYLGALGVIVRLRPAPLTVLGPASPITRAKKRR